MDIELNSVAKFQRWLLLAILLQLLAIAMFIAMSAGAFGDFDADPATMTAAQGAKIALISIVFLILRLVVIVSSITFVVLLMAAMRRPIVSRVLAGVGMIIPLIGLIVLLVVNSRATKLLQGGGYHVGLMGAKSR